MMRMTNAEQHEIFREVIRRITTPGSKPIRVFFTGPVRYRKTFVLRLIINLYNRYFNTGGVIDVHEVPASDSYLGYKLNDECDRAINRVASMSRTVMSNLPHTIILARCKPYNAPLNIDVKDGLVNGAVSDRREIEYTPAGPPSMDEEDVVRLFRFTKEDLLHLRSALRIPEMLTTNG
ncbi:hypothetical protein HPB47_026211 [Ixodes persulcatus]|uniref:Uncharacterized protein n=1 Tax=Ixodes persulcatus TaxID=34615 RepID=A0AC60PZE9_IXOPE|nr:hypothetical protein HPB47_026211 [Ixodes persulcatus]